MNYKIPLALTVCSSLISASVLAAPAPVWRAIAFGQSTDVNFSSNVLPEKVGVNDVTIDGKTLSVADRADLSKPVTLESRGGKIANSHDGLTYFYTTLPTGENFCLAGHRHRRPIRPGKWCQTGGARRGWLTGSRCYRQPAPTAAERGI